MRSVLVIALNIAIALFVSPWWLLASVPVTIAYFIWLMEASNEKFESMLTTVTIINLITILLPFPWWVWVVDLVVSVLIAANYEPKGDVPKSSYPHNLSNGNQSYDNHDGYESTGTDRAYQASSPIGMRNRSRNTNQLMTNRRQQVSSGFDALIPDDFNSKQFWNDTKKQIVDDVKDEIKDRAKDELKERTGIDLDADDYGISEVKRRFNNRQSRHSSYDDNRNTNQNSYNRNYGDNHSYGNSRSSYSDYNHHNSGYQNNSGYSSNDNYSSYDNYNNQGGGYYDNSSHSSNDVYDDNDD